MPASSPLVSVVIPVHNEAECLPKLHEELRRACDPLPYAFEFILVDDGSSDGSTRMLADLNRQDGRVRYVVLSRNFGHQAAITAGLAHAAGDAVIMMDGDLQHPPSLIPELLDRWRAGYDVVNTVRLETASISPLKRFCSGLFYRVFNWAASIRIEPAGADFRLMSRDAVRALESLPERHRFVRGLVPWIGFDQTRVEFVAPERWAGRSKYTFWRNIRLALDGITAFSFYPLRKVAMLGWMIALGSFVYGLFAIGARLVTRSTVPGWTSLAVCVVFLGGCQLFVAGVLGEYIGRILEQVKGRPIFIVRDAVGFSHPAAGGQPVPAPHFRARHAAATPDGVVAGSQRAS